MEKEIQKINALILQAAQKARRETSSEPEPDLTRPVQWPVRCTIGPGLEGGIACETKVGYVNGSKGWLIYRGYDIFDLCAHTSFEEVAYLLLHGSLPRAAELKEYKQELAEYRFLNKTLRLLMGFPVEKMNVMGSLRLGTNLMRQEFTFRDREDGRLEAVSTISSDEDSIAMETKPKGGKRAIYEFSWKKLQEHVEPDEKLEDACSIASCYRLLAGVATITAAIARVRQGRVPIEPDPELSHAANFLYMLSGTRPTPVEERIMDVALILHADHGMNASTFAAMVVASTLSDIYFSVGAGIAALNGPLHGGANEQAFRMFDQIKKGEDVEPWLDKKLADKSKIVGFGHRVYKAYDPRARILGPLAHYIVKGDSAAEKRFDVARELESRVASRLGKEKKIFPNVDYYSGIVYDRLGIPTDMFTPIFAVSRVAGWTARVHEYLQHNRIFRPRAIYTGEFNKTVPPLDQR